MRVEAAVESREVATERLPLIVLAVGSIALVTSLAYLLLGGGLEFATTGSIQNAGRLVVATLTATAIALALALIRPRPSEAVAIGSPEGLEIRTGKRSRKIPVAAIRHVLLVRTKTGWAVEVERKNSLTRLYLAEEDEALAGRLAGSLVGKATLQPVVERVRRRASYYLFVATCSMWIVVYAAICVIPPAPVLGLLLVAVTFPFAAWVTLRAIPAQVVISGDGLSVLHPLGNEIIPIEELERVEVVDDGCVVVHTKEGATLRIPELAEHPRDEITLEVPPAERLANAAQEVLGRSAA